MKSVLALAMATLLICSLSVAAVPGGQSLDRDRASTTVASDVEDGDWLAPSSSDTNGSASVGIDASATLNADATRLDAHYDTYRLDARLERAESDAERRTILNEETERLGRTVEALREHERETYRQYRNGRIEDRELAVELATIGSSANALEGSHEALAKRVKSAPEVDRSDELEEMKVEIATMQGPVRERTAEALRGEIAPVRVHVEVGANGVALATVADGQFHREAYRGSARNPEGDRRIHSFGESEERITELYPELTPRALWSYEEMGYDTYRTTGTYSEGEITVYLDRATTDVYREELILDLDHVETTPLESETANGMRLSLEGTTPGGPAVVSLVNNETGAPVSGEITVGDAPLGSTDDDGEVWFVLPDERTTITASNGSTTIELTVDGTAVGERASEDDAG